MESQTDAEMRGASGVQAEVTQVKEAMQRRVEEAVAETQTKASGLRDAREKNVHFSARVGRCQHAPRLVLSSLMFPSLSLLSWEHLS